MPATINIYCSRCGGNIMRDYDDITCLLCGREYDEQGNLIPHEVCQEKPQYAQTDRRQRQGKHRFKRIYRLNW